MAAGAYSSTISSIVVKVGNNSYTANSSGVATSAKLQTYGTVTVLTTVTDSRGRTATNSQNITVYNYYQPTVNIDISINGTTVTTKTTGSIASVNNQNAKRLTVVRKRLSDNTTTTHTVNPLSSYSYTDTWTQTISDIDVESYEYTATVTDTKQSVTLVKQTAIICISRLGGGKGVTFFGEAAEEGFWITNAASKIRHDITAAEYLEIAGRMALSYSELVDYEVGTFVRRTNDVYECITACTKDTWSNNQSKFTFLGSV